MEIEINAREFWKIKGFWVVIGLLLLIVAVWLIQTNIKDDKSVVKVIMLDGQIYDSGRSGITPAMVQSNLDKSKNAGAIILRINSPGGSVVASQEILASIRKFKEDTKIPILISMGDLAASGGYYIALGGDVIIANSGTLTGSIGVIAQFMYIEDLLNNIGIRTEIVKAGKYKDLGHNTMTSEEKVIMQTLADNIYEQFTHEVAISRKMELDKVKELATGEVYSGEQALKLGLVDKVGTLQTAIDTAKEMAKIDKIKLKEIKSATNRGGILGSLSRIESFIEQTFKMFEQSVSPGVQWIYRRQ